jgi:hypothetical protein
MKEYEQADETQKGYEHFPEDCLDFIDDPSHSKPGIHVLHDRLYVITTIFNPLRLRNRYWNYFAFRNMCEKAGVVLFTAEIAFGEREFEITQKDNPRHLQLRARDNQEIWLKENSLNLLIERLPVDWRYVAWIDSDVSFARPDWAQETIQLLQHYSIIQMFSQCQDYDINYESSMITPSFVYGKTLQDQGLAGKIKEGYYYGVLKPKGEKKWLYYHPGFCYACRRETFDKVGGLIDWAILGAGDFLMAHALYGKIEEGRTINAGYSENYKQMTLNWQDRALKHIRKNVGYMPGLIHHWYHGKKEDRKYNTRWKLLVETKFDPLTDIKRDSQGLWQLNDDGSERFILLRDGLRKYARLRNEDSNTGILIP